MTAGELVARLLDHATAATDQLHGLVEHTAGFDPIPPAGLAPLLVQLEHAAYELDQALRQLGECLTQSRAIDHTDRTDSADLTAGPALALAGDQLDDAATHHFRAGRHLAAARDILQPAPPSSTPSTATRRRETR